ncbi:MAG: 50S ribosomal protein L17 [Candidatus Paceibacterota bacterium]|nr:MAG: 50S ribosomal protein L17 [Candidatus Paceibacterota bacterium]
MKRGNVRKFGRERNQRIAFVRSLATALIEHGAITTTTARAKTLTSAVAKMITLGKKGTVAARRELMTRVGKKASEKLVKDISVRFASRPGGYTRLVPLGKRPSDGSPMVRIEFVA